MTTTLGFTGGYQTYTVPSGIVAVAKLVLLTLGLDRTEDDEGE